MTIVPTVGRVVWFYPPGRTPDQQPQAALIAHVLSDTCVNLAIFDDNGVPYPAPPTSVLLVQEGNPVPSGGSYCTWMPYQRAVAAGQMPPMQHGGAGHPQHERPQGGQSSPPAAATPAV